MGKGSGPGSTLEVGEKLVSFLSIIIKKYKIRTINDAGCGIHSWFRNAAIKKWKVQYQGYDIDPMMDDVIKLDITSEEMPKADLIICKDVFRHLDLDQVNSAISLFDSKYLLCDTDPGAPNDFNSDRPLDMELILGEPIMMEKSIEKGNKKFKWHKGKYFGLWRINGKGKRTCSALEVL